MASNADLTLEAFTILREHFFDQSGAPKPFPLREKRNTQDNPQKAIERSFPFVEISEIAERQSWRKDVYQPVYYIMMARLITTLSRARDLGKILDHLSSAEREMGAVVERVWKRQNPREMLVEERQMRLF
jgi:hypothetical protein